MESNKDSDKLVLLSRELARLNLLALRFDFACADPGKFEEITYSGEGGRKQYWHLNTNWKFIIIGAVILIAVILDQVVHLLQDRRRTRMAGAAKA